MRERPHEEHAPDPHQLLRVLLHRPEWHDAACRGRGPGLF